MTVRRPARLAVILLALVVLAAACGDDDDGGGDDAAEPAPAAVARTLQDVEIGEDSVTFVYHERSPDLLDDAWAHPPFTSRSTEEAEPVDVDGEAFLRLAFAPGIEATDSYAGPERYEGRGVITEVVHQPDAEGYDAWIIGLAEERTYRIDVEAASVRVYFST